MIQPNQSGSIEIPAQVFNGIWIKSIQINAPSPTKKISANIYVCPFNSSTGEMASNNTKQIIIQDIENAAVSSSYVANVMFNIFGYVQEQVISKSLF